MMKKSNISNGMSTQSAGETNPHHRQGSYRKNGTMKRARSECVRKNQREHGTRLIPSSGPAPAQVNHRALK